MSTDTTAPSITERAFYRHWHRIAIRHADLDDLHHVNNSVYSVYCEEARRVFWHRAHALLRDHEVMQFVVRLALDFRSELTYPGDIDVGTTISRIGNSSYGMMQALFTETGCHATIEVVTVMASRHTRRATPIPPPLREFMQQNMHG